ncbi:MAG: glycosyltransferase family 2 protein [Desulfomonilaceae bacterium]|nr:glycosyltransferase family 2 protein [Desulfomonilaceae bacterium]
MTGSKTLDSSVISVVVPLYNEKENVPVFVERIERVFSRLGCKWELVFALDPSTDGTREAILKLMDNGYPIRLIHFSRRFGKPLSLLAGLEYSTGDACVIIDVDLQDPPELIEAMVDKWLQGFEVVIAQRRSRRGEHYLYLKSAELFYKILNRFSEVHVPENSGDFRMLDARVVREICRFRERHGFLRGITAAVGFSTTVVTFDREPRLAGKTQIPLRGAVNIALDGIIPFSRVPVRMVFLMGSALSALALAGTLVWIVSGLLKGFSSQWPILLLGLLSLCISALTLTALGIIGEYVLRTYEEARDRPRYIVDEVVEARTIPRRRTPDEAGRGCANRRPK